jgi:hypothetical protein
MNKDELPEICKECPENECCNHDPKMWKCEETEDEAIIRKNTEWMISQEGESNETNIS